MKTSRKEAIEIIKNAFIANPKNSDLTPSSID